MNRNKLTRRQEGLKRAERVLRVYRAVWNYNDPMGLHDGKFAKRLIKTRVPCSCPMCGNPRRHFGQVTRQERQHETKTKRPCPVHPR